ncbi:MAG: hypothetical protein VB064_07085 [Oscillospiraceae bacterium]|nr:hypothetical protein [Oscillospiraceae bacterium]
MKKNLLRFLLFTLVFVVSTFLHECAHGIQSSLSGFSVSTGFNRIGNAFKYPGDADFRTGLGLSFSLDAAVLLTLTLAVTFTLLYLRMRDRNGLAGRVVFSFACSNSIIRLVPALLCLVLPVFGIAHTEDETDMGRLWAEASGIASFNYLPAIISVLISVLCIYFIVKKRRKGRSARKIGAEFSLIAAAYAASFFVENLLDRLIRINWTA